ncbi:MAG: hypothetical protein WCO52_04695 [bacterium]
MEPETPPSPTPQTAPSTGSGQWTVWVFFLTVAGFIVLLIAVPSDWWITLGFSFFILVHLAGILYVPTHVLRTVHRINQKLTDTVIPVISYDSPQSLEPELLQAVLEEDASEAQTVWSIICGLFFKGALFYTNDGRLLATPVQPTLLPAEKTVMRGLAGPHPKTPSEAALNLSYFTKGIALAVRQSLDTGNYYDPEAIRIHRSFHSIALFFFSWPLIVLFCAFGGGSYTSSIDNLIPLMLYALAFTPIAWFCGAFYWYGFKRERFRSHQGAVLDDFCVGFKKYLTEVEIATCQVRPDHVPYIMATDLLLLEWNEVARKRDNDGSLGVYTVPWYQSDPPLAYSQFTTSLFNLRNDLLSGLDTAINERDHPKPQYSSHLG